MNRVFQTVLSLAFAVVALFAVAVVPYSTAQASIGDQVTKGIDASGGDRRCPASGCGLGSSIQIVVNVLLFIIGVIAVIMLIIGGIRYTTSNGDSSQITSAKNTVMYSVVGLVIALLAYAIINFVIANFN